MKASFFARSWSLVIGLVVFSGVLASSASGSITLRGGGLVFSYDPSIGRVVDFRREDGPNMMLTEHPTFGLKAKSAPSYIMRGGERLSATIPLVWRYRAENPLQPGRYDFLPDEAIDGASWKVIKQNETTLVVESSSTEWLGVVARRTFTLHAAKSFLEVQTVLTRVSRSPIPVHAWSISMIPPPDYFLLSIDPSWRHVPLAWTELSRPGRLPADIIERSDRVLKFTIPQNPEQPKVGAMGSWVAAIYKKAIFLQAIEFHPDDSYPDASSVQAYARPGFAEIETLSPSHFLPVGKALSSRSFWTILTPPGSEDMEHLLEKRAEEMLSSSTEPQRE